MKLFLTAALIATSALIGSGKHSLAAEFFILPGTNSLLVLGETEVDDASKISDYVINQGVDTLILKGPGGNLDTAFSISNVVLEHSVNTTVPAGTECASACAIIFSSGNRRTLENNARLGFHLPFMSLNSNNQIADYCRLLLERTDTRSQRSQYEMFTLPMVSGANADCVVATYQLGLLSISKLNRIFDRDGISGLVIEAMISTLPTDMTWFDHNDARNLGLTNSDIN